MKKLTYILMIALLAVVTTSCVSQRDIDKNYAPFKPDVVRLDLTMDDYVYLGDVTVEVEYKTYLGIPKILTVNGQAYDPRYVHRTNIAMGRKIRLGVIKKALYKITDTYRDADYILPVSDNEVVQHMFMGRIKRRTVTFKVFQLAKSSGIIAEQAKTNEELKASQQEAESLRQQRDELQGKLNDSERRIKELEAQNRNSQKRK